MSNQPHTPSAPIYAKIIAWVQSYGSSGQADQFAVNDFLTCESPEAMRGLQAELIAVSQGKFSEENFDKLVGVKRKGKHGSYQEWAKVMLVWIASYKG